MKRFLWLVLLLLLPSAAWAQHVTLLDQTFAFEDVPGANSDLDWNDAVVRYSAICDLDSSGNIVRQRIAFVGVAAGAQLDNTLQLRMPVAASLVQAVARDGVQVTPSNDVVVLLASFKDGFTGSPQGFVNTQGTVDADGIPHTVTITFQSAQNIACPVPGFELTRPALAVPIDATRRLSGSNLPMAGNFDGTFRPPRERISIGDAYPGDTPSSTPSFAAWVADISDGSCDTACSGTSQWWQLPMGSRVDPRDAAALAASAPLPVLPTCTDGVQNGDETGRDCGDPLGICGPCAVACGPGVTVSHTGYFPGISPADHAPFNGTYTYNTVSGDDYPALGAGKCWTTSNIGAQGEALSWDDIDPTRTGWYFQFNRKQGYYADGWDSRTPNTPWENPVVNPSVPWRSTEDPCTLLLGSPWRIPTKAEWIAFQSASAAQGGLDSFSMPSADPYASPLVLSGSGGLQYTTGYAMVYGDEGDWWSSTLSSSSGYAWYAYSTLDPMSNWYTQYNHAVWSFAYPVRCVAG